MPGRPTTAASKAALIGYVGARAATLDERGGTINAVALGFIETAMTRRMPLMMVREAGRRLNSLKQGGTPADVGRRSPSWRRRARTRSRVRSCGSAGDPLLARWSVGHARRSGARQARGERP